LLGARPSRPRAHLGRRGSHRPGREREAHHESRHRFASVSPAGAPGYARFYRHSGPLAARTSDSTAAAPHRL